MMKNLENMLEVRLFEQDDFLKIKETLTRIGISSKTNKVLFQSCHILHKQGKYWIVHFKEMFALDNKPTNIDANDIARRNTIALLLEDWGLLEVVNYDEAQKNQVSLSQIKILNFDEKKDWQLVPKYNIGQKKKKA